MSFWSWWSRRPIVPSVNETEPRPIFTDADRLFIKAALDRFEANGLRIWSELNRDLIVARALVDIARWRADGEAPGPDLQPLFLALASGTDSLTWYVDDVEEQFPPLASMDDETAETMLEQHSCSIFVNASSINLVNEGGSLERIVLDFAALADLSVEQVSQHPMSNGLTSVSFKVEGLDECHFEIESRKRPDVTPALAEMTRITRALGRYIRVPEGSSESDTFIFANETTLPKIIDLLDLEPIEAAGSS